MMGVIFFWEGGGGGGYNLFRSPSIIVEWMDISDPTGAMEPDRLNTQVSGGEGGGYRGTI